MLTHMDKNAVADQPLCAVLREVMDGKNLTEHGLAVRTGIASTTLQRRFASGTFTLNELDAIGKVLSLPSWELLRRADEREVGEQPHSAGRQHALSA